MFLRRLIPRRDPTRPPFPWRELGAALVLLGLVGASCGLFLALVALPGFDLTSLLAHNDAPVNVRRTILIFVLVGLAAPILGGLVATIVKRRRAVEVMARLATLLGPLALLAFVPILGDYRAWHDTPLP